MKKFSALCVKLVNKDMINASTNIIEIYFPENQSLIDSGS